MGRLLAIDFGTKRCGLAVSDPDRIIASGLDTVPTKELFDYLAEYFKQEVVDIIVLGDPKKLDGSENELSEKVDYLIKVLNKKYPGKTIEKMDERYSSKMAQQTLLASGAKKKQRRKKELLDKISATLILQAYMETL